MKHSKMKRSFVMTGPANFTRIVLTALSLSVAGGTGRVRKIEVREFNLARSSHLVVAQSHLNACLNGLSTAPEDSVVTT